MPYHVVKKGTKFVVEKQDGSRSFGTHDTREEADRQLSALYAAEKRTAESRELHLLGALGQVRTEMVDNREHLVVPVVALMEGVIHAVNAETPEFVPVETLEKAAASWNGKPVTLGHPRKDGKQCSAQDAAILEAVGLGTIRNSRVEGKKLLCEALIETARAKRIHPDMYARLADGGTEEVSVGALVITDKKPGTHASGKSYLGTWVMAEGDHLAFLPGSRGACSVAMGCGTHRAAMRVCEDRLEDVIEEHSKVAPRAPSCLAITTLEDQPLSDRITAVSMAVSNEWNDPPEPYAYAAQVFDDFAIVCKGEETFKVPYTVADDGTVTLGKPVAVKQQWVVAQDDEQIKVLAGARHSTKDMGLIQAVHDHAMALGASCDRGNMKTMQEKQQQPANIDDPTRRYIAMVRKSGS